ncbi:MAG: hypothetical protein F6K00_09060 [Leptolyngbya sp. SIOISBB]|nr:hypothetical protein [Leptolyngbya sp. SIOISBB]
MLPNLVNSLLESVDAIDVDIDFMPDAGFFDNSFSELLAAISPEAEALLLDGVDTLIDTTGELAIAAGVLEGTVSTPEDGPLPILFDAPAALTELGDLLTDASGSLSLVDGFVNAVLELDDDQYEIIEFDLATFAADGLSFLISEAETVLPIVNGTVLVSEETPLGLVEGAISFGGGSLDVDIETPAGAFDLVIPFSPDTQFAFAVPTPLGPVDANVDFFTGIIAVPFLPGLDIEVPLDSLSGELELDDGTASLTLDTLLGPIETNFEVDALVSDTVVDFLTGVTFDAQLLSGQLDILATSGEEAIATAFDLVDLNNQVIEFVAETNGDLSLDSGLLSGFISVGTDTLDIEQSVDDLLDLLAVPLSELFALAPGEV